jgi:hypothetical protein
VSDTQDKQGPSGRTAARTPSESPGASPAISLRSSNRRRSRWLLRGCGALGLIVFFAVVAAGLFMLRLAQGPMAIALVGEQIKAAIADQLGSRYQVRLGDTLIVAGVNGPALSIDGFSLKDQSGRTVVAAPKAAVSVDPFALLAGKVSLKRLELQDLELRLVMIPDGTIAISAGTDPAEAIPLRQAMAVVPNGAAAAADAPALPPDRGAVAQAEAALTSVFAAAADPDNPIGALQRLGIAQGRLVVDDRALDQPRVYDGFNLSFDKSDGGNALLTASANGPQGHWSIAAQMSGRPGEPRQLQFDFQELSLDEILIALGVRDIGVDFDMAISGKGMFGLSPQDKLVTARTTFAFGAGYIRVEDPDHEPFLIDELTGDLAWDEQAQQVKVDKIQLFAGETNFAVTGTIVPPTQAGQSWRIALASEEGVFGAERPGEKPIEAALRMEAQYRSDEQRLSFDKVEVSGPELGVAMTGEVTNTNIGTRLRLNVAAERRMPIPILIRLWPSFIVADVRAWFLANVQGGMVEEGTIAVDFDEAAVAAVKSRRPVPEDGVHLVFSVSDGRVTPVKGLPPLTGVEGKVVITGRNVSFQAPHAVMDAGPGRRLTLTEGAFVVADTTQKPPLATISARVTGGADVVAELLARDALKGFAPLPVDPAAVKGQLDGRLAVDLRLSKNPQATEPQIRVNASLANLTLDKLIGQEKLEAANLTLSIDRSGLKAKGDGRLFGVPANVDVKRPANAAGEATLTFTLDDAARAKHGLGVGAGVIGPIGARISTPLSGGSQKAIIELDLSHAALDGTLPGLAKPAGRPAKATLSAELQADGTSIDPLVYEGNGALLHGSAKFDSEGNLVQAKLSPARFSAGDDMKIELNQSAEGSRVVVRGNVIDARPFLPLLLNPTQGRDHKDFDLDLKTAALAGLNGEVASGVELHIGRRANQLQQLQLTARFGRAPIAATLSRHEAVPTVAVTSTDAGAVLAFFDFYRRMKGGELAVTLRPADTRLVGNVIIRDFVLKDEPAMRRLVADESVNGQRFGNPDIKLDASAVPFNKLSVSFSRTAGRIDLREGVMWGPQIGATVEGSVDFAADRVNLGGTFVPAYQLNNLFSKIPLVGMLLGGGKDEGLLGINYRIGNTVSAPVLTFNPLSAMTPGFLRKIFGAIDGTDVRLGSEPAQAFDGNEPAMH